MSGITLPMRTTRLTWPGVWQVMSWVVASLAIGLFLALALWANLDASQGRHMLFMDELISFDGAEAIRTAETPFHAVREAVLNDQRYGRTMHYLSFASSSLGGVFAGEQGQIVATRMAFTLTVCAGVCLLAWTLLRTPLGRAAGLAAGLSVPFSAYYATMPKPDPLMIAFLALYLWAWKRKGTGLGYPMIWLGLAFGAKIAAMPAAVILILLAYVQLHLTGQTVTRADVKKSLLGFLAGWLISVPAVIASFPNGLIVYIQETWLNRGHALDVAGTGLLDWLALLHRTAFFGPGLASSAVIAVFAALILFGVWSAAGRPRNAGNLVANLQVFARSDLFLPFAAALAGAASLGAIMLSTERLWQFYLFPGTLLVTIGALAALEHVILARGGLATRLRITAAALGAIALTTSTASGAVHTYGTFSELAERSQSEKFQRLSNVHTALTKAAREAGSQETDTFRVAYNADFWHPSSDENVRYMVFYTAFWQWHLELDMVALTDHDVDITAAPGPFQTLPKKVEALRLLPLHTDRGGPCTQAPCYRELPTDATGLHLFVRDAASDPAGSAATSSPPNHTSG